MRVSAPLLATLLVSSGLASLAQNTGGTAGLPILTLSTPDGQAAETAAGATANNGVFVITRSGNTNTTVTVSLIRGGTAQAGIDYQSLPETVTLAAGRTRAEIPVRPIDDNLVESGETVTIRLANPPCLQLNPLPGDCYTLGLPSEGQAVIADNDVAPPTAPSVISVTAVSPEATEGGNSTGSVTNRLSFLFRRGENTATSLSVAVQFGGTATRGQDYTVAPEQVTFGPGQSEILVHVTPLQDSQIEGDESVVVGILPCTSVNATSPCYILGTPAQASGVLHDDDRPVEPAPAAVVSLAVADAQAAETGANHTSNPAVFVLTRTGATNTPLSVSLAISGTATGGVDFQPIPNPVTLAAGQIRLEIALRPVDDTLVEPEESVVLHLLAPPCAAMVPLPSGCYQLGSSVEASARILDNDVSSPVPAVLTLETVNGQATEAAITSNTTTNRLSFLLRRRENTAGSLPVVLNWTGSAARGSDYSAPEVVTLASGQAELVFHAFPIQDLLVEGNEAVTVALRPCASNTTAVCYQLGSPAVATGVIRDDDVAGENRAPVVTWVAPAAGASFTAPPELILTAAATDADGRVTRVTFLAEGQPLGTVTNVSPQLTAFAGTSTSSLFAWTWVAPAPGEYHLQAEAEDEDGAVTRTAASVVFIRPATSFPQTVVSLTAVDREAVEPGLEAMPPNIGVFRARREGDLSIPLDVRYRVGGSASNGVDYTALDGVLRFAAGQSVKELVVSPLPDNVAEGQEFVRVSLEPIFCIQIVPAPPECYRLGSASADQVFIADSRPPENLPPVAQVVHPWPGQVFAAPAALHLLVEVMDSDGSVASVEFFSGDVSLGLAEPVILPTEVNEVEPGVVSVRPGQPRFQLAWTNVPPGRYVIRAVATDDDGARASSRPVEIKVLEMTRPAVVTVTATDAEATEPSEATLAPDVAVFTVRRDGPTNNALRVFLQLGGSARPGLDYRVPEIPGVLIPAGAHEAELVLVPQDDEVPEGTESIEVAVIPPRWLNTADGGSQLPVQYVVGDPARATARLYDNDAPATNLAPRVRLVRPEGGAVFTAPARIGLAAEAVDLDGTVAALEFLADGSVISPINTNLLNSTRATTFVWEDVPVGRYRLLASARDDRGATALSEPVEVSVLPPSAPVEVEVFAVDPRASEAASGPSNQVDIAVFRFRRTGDPTNNLTVAYAISGTASNGVDYAALSGVVTFPTGRLSVVVNVIPRPDNVVEREPETVVLSIRHTDAGPYVRGPRAEAAAYIADRFLEPVTQGLRGGEFLMDVPTPLEGLVSIQVSTNLVDWSHICTVPALDGHARFVDPEARSLTRRFYQAVPAVLNLEALDD